MKRCLPSRPRSGYAGFTLVEILIVVVILGILAAIVIPKFANATSESSKSVFAANLRSFVEATSYYQFENGEYPEDGSSGAMPTGFEAYVDSKDWVNGTPIGGVWDTEADDLGGVKFAVGVHFDGTGVTRDDSYMLEIDRQIDDGDLETGSFQKLADQRYYSIVAE